MSDSIQNTLYQSIIYIAKLICITIGILQAKIKCIYEDPINQEYAATICLSGCSLLQRFKAYLIECYQTNQNVKKFVDGVHYFYQMCNSVVLNRRFEPQFSHWISISTLIFQDYNQYNDIAYGKEHCTKLNEQFDTIEMEGTSFDDSNTDFDFNDSIKEWFHSIITIVKNDDTINDAVVTIKNNDRYNYTIITKTTQDIPKLISFEPSSVRFLSTEIYLPKSDTNYVIELDKRHFSVGNELFSPAFVKRLLEYQHNKFDFDFEYVIKIMDNSINNVELKSGKYILIEKNKYSIMDL